MAGLPHKVKLAINTKTYTDDNGEDFTVSMSVYDKEDFTGLGTFNILLSHWPWRHRYVIITTNGQTKSVKTY